MYVNKLVFKTKFLNLEGVVTATKSKKTVAM